MPRLSAPLVGRVLALGLLCALLGACGTDGPETTTSQQNEDTAAASADSATADADTLSGPQTPPPGTARIRATIATCDAAADPVRCEVRVEEVLGYGSATPPLSTGTHTVAVASSLLTARDATTLATLGPRTFVVQHAGDRPNLGEHADDTRPEWTIQSIE
ncbi:MAG: hypothetical protein ABEL51_02885 [Salinibacter sp.]